ncbi:MAG: 16S rRNA (cytosine(967)-C(5))-methyltransferase RsmB [Deltaproteobacteria bacterium]|jgi:16S rRNA (cytosine967-C5)-methyltransferase|nr:16S rRNA (cytosine(967)-C(5))-methyltransferase RsmB [Deltaproteobacteria bacterium]
MKSKESMVNNARKTSLYILNTLDQGNKTLDNILDEVLSHQTFLSRKDRALLQAIVYGVLRWRAKLDWIIHYFSKTPLNQIDPKVMNILRIALFQIIYLNRIPVSAAVNTSVEMAKSVTEPYVVRFVNALLRNAAKKYQHVSFPDVNQDPASALAVKQSFPKWLLKRWLDRFGLKETVWLCDAINTIPPITVRCNTLRIRRETLCKFLEKDVQDIEYTKYAPDGALFFNPKKSIPEMKAFEDGLFQVQDEAAQLITFLLNPKPGETVLDACAGLGGKTGHISQMMNNRGKLIAMDNNVKKLHRLQSEMVRLGISMVTPSTHDLNEPVGDKSINKYDRILLDAPCSGLGVLRRNPDAKWNILEQDLIRHAKRQATFLDNLAHQVKPQGLLVYCVCSTEPEENESVIKGFLNKHKDFAIKKNPGGLPYKARSLLTDNGYLKTFPHLHNMDGFFAVCMKRKR